MRRILTVAGREFLATVRTKAFLLSVVLMPGLILGAIYGGEWIEKAAREEQQPLRRVAVVDYAGGVYPNLLWQVAAHNAERPNQVFELEATTVGTADAAAVTAELTARVRSGELYGFIIIPTDALEGAGACTLARRDNQLQLGRRLETWVREAVIAARLRADDLDPQRIHAVRDRPVAIENVDGRTGGPVSEHTMARFMTPFAFMFLLFMGTFGIRQGLLTTLIEEKGSRVVEVLLSAVSPTELLAGKILGLAAVGLLLLGVWGGVGYNSARTYHLTELVTGYRLTIAVLYFIPGFLLISSLLAAIGSACNELRDAQSMVFPLSLLTIIPMVCWFYIAEHPAAAFSLVLSFIPTITPFVMMLRVCSDPDTPVWQIAATLALLWGSVVTAIWAAGRVFRIGVLMYGKPPTPRELLRWVRQS